MNNEQRIYAFTCDGQVKCMECGRDSSVENPVTFEPVKKGEKNALWCKECRTSENDDLEFYWI